MAKVADQCILISIISCTALILYYYQFFALPSSTIITDYIEFKITELPKKRAVTTKVDRDWCDLILNHYENNSNVTDGVIYTDGFNHPTSGHYNPAKKYRFTSQGSQDWFLYTSIFRNMPSIGFYIELAANDYLRYSNSFFFDKCLSWNGICIEAAPSLIPNLRYYRNCDVIPTCVWNTSKELTFETNAAATAVGGLQGYNKIKKFTRPQQFKKTQQLKLICKTVSEIVDEYNIKHIDYLSLDIEGSELPALQGVNFDVVNIDVITVELNTADTILKFLINKNFIPKITIYGDMVFVNKNAKDKLKWIDDWIDNKKWQKQIDFLHPFTKEEGY